MNSENTHKNVEHSELFKSLMNIVETMGTITKVEWHNKGNVHMARIVHGGILYILEMEVNVFVGTKCAEIKFGVFDPQTGKVNYQLFTANENVFALLGGISNAFRHKCTSENVEVVMFIAVDNVIKRMDVYNLIAKKIAKHFGSIRQNVDLGQGCVATFLYSSGVQDDFILSLDLAIKRSIENK